MFFLKTYFFYVFCFTYWLLCSFFCVCHSVCLFFTWWSKSILAISAILSRPKHCSDLLSETILKLWVFMFQWDLQLLNHIPRLVNFVIFNNILFLFQNYDQINEWILSLKSGKFIVENSKNYLDYTVCTLNVRHDIFTITGLLLSANYLETRRSFLLLAQVKSTFALEEKKNCVKGTWKLSALTQQ